MLGNTYLFQSIAPMVVDQNTESLPRSMAKLKRNISVRYSAFLTFYLVKVIFFHLQKPSDTSALSGGSSELARQYRNHAVI